MMTTNAARNLGRYIAPWLAAAAIGIGTALPSANGDPNPLVPYDTDPTTTAPNYHVDNDDEANTTNGFVDAPF